MADNPNGAEFVGPGGWVLGAKFLSHRPPGQAPGARGRVPAPGTGLAELDHQQALVLAALRRAAGAPVSYAELRAAGVELPASVVSELELAGMAIERCSGAGRGAVEVRLDPANDPAARATPCAPDRPMPIEDREPSLAWSTAQRYRTSSGRPARHRRRGNPGSRAIALAGLLAGIVAAALFVATWPLGRGGTRTPAATRPPPTARPPSRAVVAAAGAAPAAPRRSSSPPPVPVSPALATRLEARGHGLLEAGRYGEAVPVLKRAVIATGETPGACRELARRRAAAGPPGDRVRREFP
jgi:hypothetical protein